MDVKYINPFIESIHELFSKMLNCRAESGEVGLLKDDSLRPEITALIGLGGPVRGMVALAFPLSTALEISSRLQGREVQAEDESVADAISECVNIVAGCAKAKLSGGEEVIDLSLPTVIRGKSYDVRSPTWALWLEIPFRSDLGPFHLRVSLASIGRKDGRKDGKSR